MKKLFVLFIGLTMIFGFNVAANASITSNLEFVPVPVGDWGHPIKWDQMDGISTWGGHSTIDESTDKSMTTDDFLCDGTPWITDIRFAGWSSYGNQYITDFRVTFWDDVPATSDDESHPGSLLYDETFGPAGPDGLGWKDLEDGTFGINIPRENWFAQQGGNIYWIGIQGVMEDDGWADNFYWNFRDIAMDTWGDDAAFKSDYFGYAPWYNWGWVWDEVDGRYEPDMFDGTLPPDFEKSADMAYQLSGVPIPGTLLLLGSGLAGLAGIRRKFSQRA